MLVGHHWHPTDSLAAAIHEALWVATPGLDHPATVPVARIAAQAARQRSERVVTAWDAYLRDDDDQPDSAAWCELRDAIDALRGP